MSFTSALFGSSSNSSRDNLANASKDIHQAVEDNFKSMRLTMEKQLLANGVKPEDMEKNIAELKRAFQLEMIKRFKQKVQKYALEEASVTPSLAR